VERKTLSQVESSSIKEGGRKEKQEKVVNGSRSADRGVRSKCWGGGGEKKGTIGEKILS